MIHRYISTKRIFYTGLSHTYGIVLCYRHIASTSWSRPVCCFASIIQYSVVIFMNLIGRSLNAIETCFVGLYCNRDPSLRLSKLFTTIAMLFSTQELFIM